MDPKYSTAAKSLRAAQQKYSARFGRFFSAASICREIPGGMDLETLEAEEAQFRYLSVVTSDGLRLYPALQLDETGELLDGLSEILKLLLPVAGDGWSVLYWLTAPQADWDHRTPAEVLEDGDLDEIDAIIELARSDAESWASAMS